jgi:hypothetical protein
MIILSDFEMVTGLLSMFFFFMTCKTVLSTPPARINESDQVVMEVLGRGKLKGRTHSVMSGTIVMDSKDGIKYFSLNEKEIGSGINRSYDNW